MFEILFGKPYLAGGFAESNLGIAFTFTSRLVLFFLDNGNSKDETLKN